MRPVAERRHQICIINLKPLRLKSAESAQLADDFDGSFWIEFLVSNGLVFVAFRPRTLIVIINVCFIVIIFARVLADQQLLIKQFLFVTLSIGATSKV